jgi:hypothetical protein
MHEENIEYISSGIVLNCKKRNEILQFAMKQMNLKDII